MKQLPKIKILAVAIALQFVLLVGAGVALENKNEQHITMAGLYTSVSQTRIVTLLSNIDSNDHVGQANGSIILNPRYGTDSNVGGLVTCNRGYHIGDKASCGPCELLATIQRVLRFLILVSALLASIMFTYAGFLYLTSSVNPGNIAKAKGIFWNVLFGFVAVLGAWIVINTVLNTLAGRPLTAVSQIACEYDRRDPSYLPNPSVGVGVALTPAQRETLRLSGIDSQLNQFKAEYNECLLSSVSLSDQRSCDSQYKNRIYQLEHERDLRKTEVEARLAELNREYNQFGCKASSGGNPDSDTCRGIQAEIDKLNSELNGLPATGTATTPPTGPNNTVGSTQATQTDLTTKKAIDAAKLYESQGLSKDAAIQEAYRRQQLEANGIFVNKAPCIFTTTNCTDTRGLTDKTVTYVSGLNKTPGCNLSCDILVTGGSEGGHAPGACSHGSGCKVDIASKTERGNTEITRLILSEAAKPNNGGRFVETTSAFGGHPTYKDMTTGAIFVLESDHWDVQVPQQ